MIQADQDKGNVSYYLTFRQPSRRVLEPFT